jgi:uncharacterized protein
LENHLWLMLVLGVLTGIAAAFWGVGGGIVMVPMMLFLGFTAQKAVGTSLFAILIISVSAIVAHSRLANVDYKMGVLLGVGGIVGAQIGARLVEHLSTASFKKTFALVLWAVGVYFFVKK